MTDSHLPLLEVDALSVRKSGQTVLDHISFKLSAGECLAVIGARGSGKTTLVEALAGQLFHDGRVTILNQQGRPPKLVVIGRQHRFKNKSNIHSFYYQQRYNSFDGEDSCTVEEELMRTGTSEPGLSNVLEALGISGLRHTRLIQLSNGEHKRFQIAEALLQKAEWLLFDCPYIGLDVDARKMLNAILDDLVQKGIQVLLVSSKSELPDCISHVGILDRGKLSPLSTRKEYLDSHTVESSHTGPLISRDTITGIPSAYAYPDFEFAVRMVDTNITYGEREILRNINWDIRKGECWHLAGPNGSGKSTLLSLINGDNPQAFANEIYLFDRRKGSGESIWDIKRNIGYISPELHHYVETNSTCFDIVASGLFDTMGLFRKLNALQAEITLKWMQLLHVDQFASTYFNRLSDGEQRSILLARTMVKNPPMLILDEPCQGLDDADTETFIQFTDLICNALNKTLIYVSHYNAEIPQCITRQIVLEQGRIVRYQ